MTPPPALLAPGDVAAILSVPVSWVRDHSNGRRSPQIPCFKVGKYWRYRRDEIERWLALQKREVA